MLTVSRLTALLSIARVYFSPDGSFAFRRHGLALELGENLCTDGAQGLSWYLCHGIAGLCFLRRSPKQSLCSLKAMMLPRFDSICVHLGLR